MRIDISSLRLHREQGSYEGNTPHPGYCPGERPHFEVSLEVREYHKWARELVTTHRARIEIPVQPGLVTEDGPWLKNDNFGIEINSKRPEDFILTPEPDNTDRCLLMMGVNGSLPVRLADDTGLVLRHAYADFHMDLQQREGYLGFTVALLEPGQGITYSLGGKVRHMVTKEFNIHAPKCHFHRVVWDGETLMHFKYLYRGEWELDKERDFRHPGCVQVSSY